MLNFLKRRWYFIIIILIIIAGGYYFQKTTKEKKEKEEMYTVKRQDLKDVLTISGEIDAEEKANLRFKASGKLTWVGVKVGDYVEKYQGIASLDQIELKKNMQKSLNTYVQKRDDYDQSEDDYDPELEERSVGDEYVRLIRAEQMDLNNAVLDVELQDISIKYSYLYTPIEGMVIGVEAPNAGVNITPATANFDIINPNTLYFSAIVDQTEVVKLKEGLSAKLILDSYPDKELKVDIYFISFIPKTGETGTVYEVKLKMNDTNEDYKYKMGMTGDATFKLKEIKNVIAVPSSYIKGEGDKQYVYVDKDAKKQKVIVKTGLEIDNMIEIKQGLVEGDLLY